MPGVHYHHHTVRFGECDPAGVVYFPIFFDWFHQAMESWFDVALGTPYAEILQTLGFPAVHTEADFRRPCRIGEKLRIELSVGELSRKSLRLEYRVLGDDDRVKATGATVCAVIAPQPGAGFRFKAVSVPESLRDSIQTFMERDDD
ncbi:MAG: 4-hydroxybenzoyl-CoA thioesterase [Myxococcota bacterium]|jgi:4-hydroxybenzoyl-CoA thioesterase